MLLLGKEKEGLPQRFLAQVDQTVEIPQFGLIRCAALDSTIVCQAGSSAAHSAFCILYEKLYTAYTALRFDHMTITIT